MPMREAYRRAVAMLTAGQGKSVLNERIEPHWIADSRDFWFDLDVLGDDGTVTAQPMRYLAEARRIEPLAARPASAPSPKPGEIPAPDGSRALFVREHNLFCRDGTGGSVTQLTLDGAEGLDYGLMNPVDAREYVQEAPSPRPPAAVWSPDSRYFLTFRSDTRQVRRMPLVQSCPLGGSPVPLCFSYPHPIPGDEYLFGGHLYLGDAEAGCVKAVQLEGVPLSLNFASMFGMLKTKWTPCGRYAYFIRSDRFYKAFQCVIVDARSGQARVALTDCYETFGFADQYDGATYEGTSGLSLEYNAERNEIIWRSEREGRSAFYLYDADTGQTKRKLTDLSRSARSIKHIDWPGRTLYFTASGLEAEADPYYQMLCAVHLDTGAARVISEEWAEHSITFSPGGTYYLDTWSTISTVPQTAVRGLEGETLCHLATADISRAVAAGFSFPEPFKALARDGKTPIYGILVKPWNFDPSRKYPIIDYIYGGSSHINTPKAFAFADANITDPLCSLQSLAQLGFVGVIVDGLATPLREKIIHDVVYQNAGECCGLEDHVCAIGQLAEGHPWIDAERVGIWGFSGGGYAAARALLQFPVMYKVGVAICGNHDLRTYRADYVERWMGPLDAERYLAQANAPLAGRLKGKLLLIHGDMDVNVPVSSTLALARALADADKDFELLILPNAGHVLAFDPYVVRRRWDFFVRHLLGETPAEV